MQKCRLHSVNQPRSPTECLDLRLCSQACDQPDPMRWALPARSSAHPVLRSATAATSTDRLVHLPLQVQVVEFNSTTSFKEQLQIISETGVFISVHTSNLANAQFLPPGAAVIELIQRNWIWHNLDKSFQVGAWVYVGGGCSVQTGCVAQGMPASAAAWCPDRGNCCRRGNRCDWVCHTHTQVCAGRWHKICLHSLLQVQAGTFTNSARVYVNSCTGLTRGSVEPGLPYISCYRHTHPSPLSP